MTAPFSCDVIVVGAGLAGLCAALEAADRGASVVLIEKMKDAGGSSRLASGSFAFADTAAQREAGIEDNEEKLAADLMRASGDRADRALIDLYVRHQREAHAWLRAKGVQFKKLTLSSNQGVPRTHPTDPEQMIEALQARIRERNGITVLHDTPVESLLDEASGAVCGVRIRNPQAQDVACTRGVVLACGGFSRSPALIGKFAPRLEAALALGGEGNCGDGLRMAWARGADLLDMSFISGTFGISLNRYPETTVSPADNPMLRHAIYKGGIVVNIHGRRFADESISYKILGELCLAQPKSIGFQIFDQPIMNQSQPEPNSNDLKGAYEAGLIRSGPSIQSIAAAVGIEPAVLEETVARYNAGVDKESEDEFGRTSLGKGWGKLVRIEHPPFYIYPCTTAILATYCGVRVDTAMRVLNVFGAPIRGLFAAGEIIGGFHGAGYMSGSALAKAAIFGRIAGASAAHETGRA